jgi:hypothetical protein
MTIGGEKWGSRSGQLGMCAPTGTFQAQVLSHLGAKLRSRQLGHPYSGNISKVPHFQASVDHLCKNTVYMVLANP